MTAVYGSSTTRQCWIGRPCRLRFGLSLALITAAAAANTTASAAATEACDPLQPQAHTYVVARGDSLWRLMQRAGFDKRQWQSVVALEAPGDALRGLEPGQTLSLTGDCADRLQTLTLRLNALDRWVIRRDGPALSASFEHREPRVDRVRASGRIRHSLSVSLDAAGVGASTAARMAALLSKRVNLGRELRAGDRFALIYDQRHIDGQRLADGPLYAAELAVGGRRLQAFRYRETDGRVRYYDADGRSFEPVLERAPLHYRRISSPFSEHRRHPITGEVRPHHGVDYAASTGTPVHAAGRGRVRYRGRAGGYGRFVEIDHADHYQTRYGHLSAYADGLQRGDHVERGQVIGYVGSSGISTGPHLHFEIRHDGQPHDPQHMTLPGRQLEGSVLAAYRQRIAPRMVRLDHEPAPRRLAAASASLCLPAVDAALGAPGPAEMPLLTTLICPLAARDEAMPALISRHAAAVAIPAPG